MTILYKPVLIETAEQAEALPIGTVAFNPQDLTEASVRVQNGWHITGQGESDGSPYLFKHSDMVGDVVLVPMEAEEEIGTEMHWEAGTPRDTHVMHSMNMDNALWQIENNPDYATGRIMRQYRTLWEEV